MIKTWRQRCEEHPDHDGIVSDGMIQARMQEEIDELRTAMEQEPICYKDPHGCWNVRCRLSKICMDTAPRLWHGLTEDDVKAPIQRAMQHFGFDPTQYSLGGMATIGFLVLVKEIEAKLRERNA